MDPYVVKSDQSVIMDQQTLKFQENHENVPTGEIPRTFQICVDRNLAGKLNTGARVQLTGIYSIVE